MLRAAMSNPASTENQPVCSATNSERLNREFYSSRIYWQPVAHDETNQWWVWQTHCRPLLLLPYRYLSERKRERMAYHHYVTQKLETIVYSTKRELRKELFLDVESSSQHPFHFCYCIFGLSSHCRNSLSFSERLERVPLQLALSLSLFLLEPLNRHPGHYSVDLLSLLRTKQFASSSRTIHKDPLLIV